MTFSTEYFDVQKALGFKNESMSQSAFKALDEQYAPRIQRGEKDGILAIFVDNRLVLCQQNGENVAADEAEVKEFFNF